MKQSSFLLATALCLPAIAFNSSAAIADPRGCLSAEALQQAIATGGGAYMLFAPDSPSDGSINIRERPSARSRLVRVASSRNPAEVMEQTVGDDNYCWVRVNVTVGINPTTSRAITVIGWVRGDLIRIGID